MYRVDRRDFNIHETISPPEKSYHVAEDFDLTIENALEIRKPDDNVADRKSGLFIFPELSDAIKFSCVMTNSKIYKVQALPDTVVMHRGDMNWTEVMNKFLDNERILFEFADLYWKGSKTFKPCWEVLVNKIEVISIIIPNETERKRMCFQYQQLGQNVEKIDLYRDNL